MTALHVDSDLTAAELPRQCIEECSASGDVSAAVTYWRDKLAFTVDRAKAIAYLEGFGSWERADLEKETDTWIALRILWLACGSFADGEDYFYLGT